jgi:CheY-like chemotaxis protein
MKGKKILLVEDDEINGRMYQRFFSLHGFKIRWVMTGRQAIATAKRWQPHLIFLDLIIPDINGFMALEILVSHPKTKHIPVVTFSNLSKKGEVAKLLKQGARRHIVKANTELSEIMKLTHELLGAATENGG